MKTWTRYGPLVIPKHAMISYFLPCDFKMKILLWNCKGPTSPNFKMNVKDLIFQCTLNILILIETRLSSDKVVVICTNFLFDHHVILKTNGHTSGIWIL